MAKSGPIVFVSQDRLRWLSTQRPFQPVCYRVFSARFHGLVNFLQAACYPSSTGLLMVRDFASESDAPVAINLSRDHKAMPQSPPIHASLLSPQLVN